MSSPVQAGPPGSETELQIERLTPGGRGLARQDGRVWLVSGAVPGDRVRARPLKERPRWVEARTVAVVEASPERREAPCPVQAQCGGCPWMVLDEKAQAHWKREIVVEALSRIGRIQGANVAETVPSPQALHYRNKVEFTVRRQAGSWRVGLVSSGGEKGLVEVPGCMLQRPEGDRLLEHLRGFLTRRGGSFGEDEAGRPDGRFILRRSSHTGRWLVGLLGPKRAFPWAEAWAAELRPEFDLAGVVRLTSRPGARGGVVSRPLVGSDWLEESLAGTVFRLPAESFFQVNPEAAEGLVADVLELACPSPGSRWWDLFGGVGALGLALARRGAQVDVCEADRRAVACGAEAARRDGLSVSFHRATVGGFLGGKPPEPRPDGIVVNPPRSGLGRRVRGLLQQRRPGRILMVSCDPATMARDAGQLVEGGYRLVEVRPFDLFPQTWHVETVSLLVDETV